MKVNRPQLNEIPLAEALDVKPGTVIITIDEGAWDVLTKVVYEEGGTLIEMVNDSPVRSFRMKPQ